MQLDDTTFDQVRLGAVFFDPATGKKFQKVGTLVVDERPNAKATGNFTKTFNLDDTVKAHPSKIMDN